MSEAKISEAAVDSFERAYYHAWRESTISFPQRTISSHVRQANRAALEAALPHLHPQPAELAKQQGDAVAEALQWLRAALDCKNYRWDADQREAAEFAYTAALAAYQPQSREDLIALAREAIRQLDVIDGHIDAAVEKCREDLAARQPGAQVPESDECQCENGGVRYDVRGCTCSECGKRPQWYMGGRRVRITERRRTNYHPDPDTFEAVCTWHMNDDIEFRKDGETNTRRVNNYSQNLGNVEAIR